MGRMEVRLGIDPFLVRFGFVHKSFEVAEEDVYGDGHWDIQRLQDRAEAGIEVLADQLRAVIEG
jgi:hypothetical protein